MKSIAALLLFFPFLASAQKAVLDHKVYDAWQSLGERVIAANGQWVAYTVTPQEGDATLWIRKAADTSVVHAVPRGYAVGFASTADFAFFRIRAPYALTREARIKKVRTEEMPKDSFGVLQLSTGTLWKTAAVRSYKYPQEGGAWLAYHREPPASAARNTPGKADSLQRTVDSLLQVVSALKAVKERNPDAGDADEEGSATPASAPGSDLALRNMVTGDERVFPLTGDYLFDRRGTKLLLRTTRSASDKKKLSAVIQYRIGTQAVDTLLAGLWDAKGLTIDETGMRTAFLADGDTAAKAVQRVYGLYSHTDGEDRAGLIARKDMPAALLGSAVSEHYTPWYSRTGHRLHFGTAPVQPLRDTTVPDIDKVKLDIWHYADDYLQSQQLATLRTDLQRSYLAVYNFDSSRWQPLASPALPTVVTPAAGVGTWYLGITDTAKRVAAQWYGATLKDIWAVNAATGDRKLVKARHDGAAWPSAGGTYILLWDNKARSYSVWDGKGLRNISKTVPTPLYDEEADTPDDPSPYGVVGWSAGDSSLLVYDRFNVWELDPLGKRTPRNLTGSPRASHVRYRYIRVDPEERFLTPGQTLHFSIFSEKDKSSGFATLSYREGKTPAMLIGLGSYALTGLVKAREHTNYIFTEETVSTSPTLNLFQPTVGWRQRIATTNPQQVGYSWQTVSLIRWKTFSGKITEGLLYKPENFDSTKKYPMIVYFYERLSDGLHNYIAPAPTPSRLNIPFYTSRGYLVFAPDIRYAKGQPAKDAYDYIVSGVQALAKNRWVDSKNMALQGQSWGGYQVMALIAQTNMFKAAWAGAPVVNMTSAYGGIRWESGVNRQFQYERGQSRIGATLWEAPTAYLQNSPLFQFPKVNTPVVIMSNDADGAVPWYQGLEAFTALRRLGKKVWLLNYNGEAHNLLERRNRKDIQIRQQQFFDWMLKGAAPAPWLREGVPAVRKGLDWGLE